MITWRTKTWSPWDIVSLKWCVFIFGIIIGGYFPAWVMVNRWWMTVLFILLAIRPVYAYWLKKG